MTFMKSHSIAQKVRRLLSFLMAIIAVIACTKDDDLPVNHAYEASLEERLRTTDITAHPELRYFQNHPLPVGKKSLRVLCIGNSYTSDALSYLPDLMKGAGIGDYSCSIYKAVIGGASLQTWWNTVAYNDTVQLVYVAGSRQSLEKGVWKDLLAQTWDVITLQQFSGDAVNYETFNPCLRRLIDFIRANCLNQNVTLAWQTAWSYSQLYSPQMSSYERWLYISLAVQQMVMTDGIDVLIPVGTAIQNARASSLNTASELTRDGAHLDLGIGCYTASCAWFEALIAPISGISVFGNEVIPTMPPSPGASYPSQPVTKENIDLCQRCAIAAVKSPFAIVSGSWE